MVSRALLRHPQLGVNCTSTIARWNARHCRKSLSSKPKQPKVSYVNVHRPTAFVDKRIPQPIVGNIQTPQAPIQSIRTGWFWIAGVSGFLISIYCTSVFLGWKGAWEKSKTLKFDQDADVSDRYDKIATRYDDDLDLMEKAMLMGRKRRRICQKAKGHVLEVSVGTGRNGGFYKLEQASARDGPVTIRGLKEEGEKIKSIIFVDQSQEMLDICSKKWAEQHPDFMGQVGFVVADAGLKGAIRPPQGSGGFDTIIQGFGLCSMTDPVGYMRTIGSLLKKPRKGEEGGRIFLLEHGRSYYALINHVLDGLAKEHADRFGCWWNRDIGQIVKDSGLKVVELKRYHFGTTWAFELTHPDMENNDAVNKESKKDQLSGRLQEAEKLPPCGGPGDDLGRRDKRICLPASTSG